MIPVAGVWRLERLPDFLHTGTTLVCQAIRSAASAQTWNDQSLRLPFVPAARQHSPLRSLAYYCPPFFGVGVRPVGLESGPANLAAFASVALTLLASAYAVVVANEPWGEHLLLLVFPLCAFAGCAFALYVGISRSIEFGSILASSLLTALVTLSAGAAITIGNPFLRGLQGELPARRDTTIGAKPTESALLGRIPTGATLAVWGWNPEVFVLTQTISGTRESFTQFQMWPGPFEAYYIRRYVSDLERNKPEYLLDASRPFNSVAWWTIPTRFQLSNFTPVARYVAQHYVLVDRANGLKLYRRAERLTH